MAIQILYSILERELGNQTVPTMTSAARYARRFFCRAFEPEIIIVTQLADTSAPGGVAASKILPRDFLYCSRFVNIKEVCFV